MARFPERRVVFYNVANANRDQENEFTRWSVRSAALCEQLHAINADLIGLAEVRDPAFDGRPAVSWIQTVTAPSQMAFVSERYNPTSRFRLVLAWNQRMFRLLECNAFPVSPQHNVLWAHMRDEETGGEFVILLAHLAVDYSTRLMETAVLHAVATHWSHVLPVLLMGDLNTFPGQGGDEQLHMLGMFGDWLTSCVVSPSDEVIGTFLGFPHDNYRYKVNDMPTLDHFFSYNNSVHSKIQLVTGATSPTFDNYQHDNRSYATYTHPSDHMPVMLVFSFVRVQ
jgi:endonuclease/exonuclease/phosphatase family metal-dependent hydrolase